MAACRRNLLNICKKFVSQNETFYIRTRSITTQTRSTVLQHSGVVLIALGSCSLGLAIGLKSFYSNRSVVQAKQPRKLEDPGASKLTQREQRFMKFASVEYGGQLFMTPQDFLESVTGAEPRPRLGRRELGLKDLQHVQSNTPPVRKGTPRLFRLLGLNGIISYTEYLFLLSILTKPQSGFRIAFNMFDTDGDQKVDRPEFLVVTNILAAFFWDKSRQSGKGEYENVPPAVMERIFSFARLAREQKRREEGITPSEEEAVLYTTQEDDRLVVNTTLLIHFFGSKGTGILQYDDFHRFMENLQTEVIEMEFHEFSRGMSTISEVDFARILLRYTLIQADDYDAYITRLMERIPIQKGITFEEFKNFCMFLNNLDDFIIAMRMYTLADQPISQEEFHRAVKICMNRTLGEHLVNTVYMIFDEDGDGQLSYKEFIAIMKDRLHRGIKAQTKTEGWDAFRSCIKEEMRTTMYSRCI